MGDHFVLLVDRLWTESTLEAAIESRNRSLQATASAFDDTKVFHSCPKLKSSPGEIVECRICQDEDEDSNMETPCSCSGSLKKNPIVDLPSIFYFSTLTGDVYRDGAMRRATSPVKYAYRPNLCHLISSAFQQFKPGYTAPPPLFHLGRIPMNFRVNWEISRRELNNSRFIAVVSTDHSLLDSGYDERLASTPRSLIGYRTVAIIFMLLLVLRHVLPAILNGSNSFPFPLFTLFLLRTVGIILPIYVMVKVMTAVHRHSRRRQQETPNSLVT
ncbi:hypothetical protein V6N13_069725 [Hibiscus sabdariffa]|uniref:RING-CH-type domain-containing protein n=1 Tax=Hibiscus sabdariffa TaxID=183260 RepID=A0ABR2PH32_9ROSI